MSHTIAQHRWRQPMWFYEKNYHFLCHLLPELRLAPSAKFQIRYGRHQMQVQIADAGPYTQLLKLSQDFNRHSSLLHDLHMTVRVYHDAMLAEVVGYQGIKRLLARYELADSGIGQSDDKRQANLLLYDWLNMFINCSHQPNRSVTVL